MTISRRTLLTMAGALTAAAPLCKLQAATHQRPTSLKDAYKDDFYIGAALSADLIAKADPKLMAIVTRDFNSITPENCMKWGVIRTEEGGWDWKDADAFVAFGEKHNMKMVGHTLAWHSQIPDSVFKDKSGNYISKEALLKKMQDHITTLVGRYKGKMTWWDAVNEAIDDDNTMRKSHWYNIMGEDFIYNAFNIAHEVDPNAKLLYNDYNIEKDTGKREAAVELLKRQLKRGTPINGVGIQAHMAMDDPTLKDVEKAIIAYSKLGLRVHLTELDVDVLPSVWKLPVAEVSTRFEYRPERDPYTKGLPKEMEEKLAKRYESLFKLLLKHSDKIDRVTTWGISDDASWLNDFPINGRTNYPLLFNRQHEPKPAYFRLLDLKK